nr:MAG TPA: hypothetical protein [Caudoviricetes sp.]
MLCTSSSLELYSTHFFSKIFLFRYVFDSRYTLGLILEYPLDR